MATADDSPFPTGGEDDPTAKPGRAPEGKPGAKPGWQPERQAEQQPGWVPAVGGDREGRGSGSNSWDRRQSMRTGLVSGDIPATCPVCAGPARPGEPFCLRCRYDFATDLRPAVPTPALVRWVAVVEVDLDYFSRHTADGLVPPADQRPRGFPLHEDEVEIGCVTHEHRPRIGLSRRPGPLYDPAVSRDHARFLRQPDGSYAVVDRHSSNGTRVNDPAVRLVPGRPRPLADGDRVYLGAWTRITLYHLD